jgi:D-inositol-3-phosphate glycosyltransferase
MTSSPAPIAPTTARPDTSTAHPPAAKTLAVIGATHPLTGGAAQFNTAMVAGMRELGPVDFVSWTRLYPPGLHKGEQRDAFSSPPNPQEARFLLDYCDPRSWRRTARALAQSGAEAVVLPWLHPVMAPPYRYLLRQLPNRMKRVLICHNVTPHERVPFGGTLTRAVFRHADLLVTHAPQQAGEIAALGLDLPVLEAFHPRFVAADLSLPPSQPDVAAERLRQGSPELALLAYGAVRPYKGIDLALEALSLVDPTLRVKLVVAGVFWDGGGELQAQVGRLGLERRVELRPGYVSNEETALLFAAADASLLPYRSATQSGVVQLSFAHGVPVIATAVGGLPAAVRDGRDGLLSPADDPRALARAIEQMAERKLELRTGVAAGAPECSFRRYGELLHEALLSLP